MFFKNLTILSCLKGIFCFNFILGEESGGEVPDFEDDENDSDWDPPDVLYCICKQPHGNR